jgi:hypothetical protein
MRSAFSDRFDRHNVRVDCRCSICQVKFTVSNIVEEKEVISALTRHVALGSETIFEYKNEAPMLVTMYVASKGMSFLPLTNLQQSSHTCRCESQAIPTARRP